MRNEWFLVNFDFLTVDLLFKVELSEVKTWLN